MWHTAYRNVPCKLFRARNPTEQLICTRWNPTCLHPDIVVSNDRYAEVQAVVNKPNDETTTTTTTAVCPTAAAVFQVQSEWLQVVSIQYNNNVDTCTLFRQKQAAAHLLTADCYWLVVKQAGTHTLT